MRPDLWRILDPNNFRSQYHMGRMKSGDIRIGLRESQRRGMPGIDSKSRRIPNTIVDTAREMMDNAADSFVDAATALERRSYALNFRSADPFFINNSLMHKC